MDMEADRISELPEFIIQHIQSFMDIKQGTRTAVLSKYWFQAWFTRNFLDFDCFSFGFKPELIDSTLERYQEQGIRIVLCRLYATTIKERWLKLVQQSSVTELDLVSYKYMDDSMWPQIFMIKSLQVLTVYSGGKLVLSSTDIKCRNLKKLELRHMKIDEVTFQHIMCSCLSIEEVKFFTFSGQKLSAPNLGIPSFTVANELLLNVGEGGRLRRLLIKKSDINDEQLETILSKNPQIEDLTLLACKNLVQRINLSSLSLKRFKYDAPWSQVEIVIHAPNLHRLKYSSSLTSPFPVTSRITKGKVKFSTWYFDEQIDASWFLRLRELLAKFDKSNVKFSSSYYLTFDYKVLIATTPVPRGYQVEALTIKERFPSLSLWYAFFTICHPKTVLIRCYWKIKYLAPFKMLCKALSDKGNLECCKFDQNKCWRHYMKDAKFYDVVDNKQNPLDPNELEMRLPKSRMAVIILALEWECSD